MSVGERCGARVRTSLDIAGIEIDKTSLGYKQLMAVTKDIASTTLQAQARVNVIDTSNVAAADEVRMSNGTTTIYSFNGMYGIFYGCSSLESLNLSGWDMSKVEDMRSMFEGCSSLKTLNLSGWDTPNMKSISNMFKGCSSLTSLDLSGFDTSKVTRMDEVFKDCRSLKSLDLSGFSPSSAMAPDSMFFGCLSLRELNLPKNLYPGYLPGAWRGPNGAEIADYSFASKYDPAKMFGKWVRVIDMSTLAVGFADSKFAKAVHTYAGSPFEPAVKVEGPDGAYKWGSDYEVAYKANVDAGTATVTVTGVGAVSGTRTLSFKIAKASQEISAKNCKATAKAKKKGKAKALAKNVTVDLKKKAKVSAKTKVAYNKVGKTGGKLIAVNPKTGKVTLKKGLKAGKYTVKVKLTAPKGKNYKAAKTKYVTLTVVVK